MNRPVSVVLLLAGASAANAESCIDIADDQQRLACYDAARACADIASSDERLACLDDAFRSASGADVAPAAKAEVAAATQAAAPPVADETEKKVVAAEDAGEFGIKEYSEDTTKEFIDATIVEVRKAGMLQYIRLDNGQVWRDVDHGRLTFKEGRRVTITEGVLNSFDLQMEGQNKIIKVKRMQ